MKVSYPLRIDEELMERIKQLADKDSRSLNKQLEFMLKQYLLLLDEKESVH